MWIAFTYHYRGFNRNLPEMLAQSKKERLEEDGLAKCSCNKALNKSARAYSGFNDPVLARFIFGSPETKS